MKKLIIYFLFFWGIASFCHAQVSVTYNVNNNKAIKILGKGVVSEIESMKIDNGAPIRPDENIAFPKKGQHVVYFNFKDSTQVPKNFVKDIKEVAGVKFSSSIHTINEGAFSGCKGLKELFLPDEILYIRKCAFENCINLSKLRISENIQEFEFGIFSCCKNLVELNIPASVEKIGDCAFHECTSIEKLEIPNSVTEILEDAFSGCIGMTELEIPNSVNFIGDYAFYGCKKIVNVIIPYSVKWIGDYAFKECEELTITVSSATTQFGKEVFEGCKGEIYHP